MEVSKKLRVMYLTPYYKPYLGGVERVIENFSKYLPKDNDVEAVAVLTSHFAFPRKYMKSLPDKQKMDGETTIYRINGWPKIAPPYFSVPLVKWNENDVKKAIEEFKPNVIHWIGDGWFSGHKLSLKYAPDDAVIIFTPLFHPLSSDKKLWLKSINHKLCKRVDQINCLTNVEAEMVEKNYGVPREKIQIIPLGVNDQFSQKKADNSVPFTILCVGRYGAHKNQEFLINCYRKAKDKFNKPTKLVLVGRDEEDEKGKDYLKLLVYKYKLENDVLFTDEVSDDELMAWYEQADLFALFSKYESFGLAFMEALVRGVPVLTHKIKSSMEILKKGTVWVDYYSLKQATDEMVNLVNNDNLREQLSNDAKEYYKKFNWDSISKEFILLYQKTLQNLPNVKDKNN